MKISTDRARRRAEEKPLEMATTVSFFTPLALYPKWVPRPRLPVGPAETGTPGVTGQTRMLGLAPINFVLGIVSMESGPGIDNMG